MWSRFKDRAGRRRRRGLLKGVSSSSFDPLGPVFVSYRQSDGREIAAALAWSLRAAGLPVWHDQSDLPPGDFDRRMTEALASGLSGAVIIVTPEISKSVAVCEVEAPGLLQLEQSSSFSLVIANAVSTDEGSLDYGAPDLLLGSPSQRLSGFKQYAISSIEDRHEIGRQLAMERVKRLQAQNVDELTIAIRTRNMPVASSGGHHLEFRTVTPERGSRRPPLAAWEDLQQLGSYLSDLIHASGASIARISGNAHLSIAFAIGACIPITAFDQVMVEASDGQVWQLGSGSLDYDRASEVLLVNATPQTPGGSHLAAFVDVVPTEGEASAFDDHLRAQSHRYLGSLTARLVTRQLLDPGLGDLVVRMIATRIRDEAAAVGATNIALFLRTPFPAALLLGRLLNTFTVDLYEWESSGGAARYHWVAEVAAGVGGSPITKIGTNDLDEGG